MGKAENWLGVDSVSDAETVLKCVLRALLCLRGGWIAASGGDPESTGFSLSLMAGPGDFENFRLQSTEIIATHIMNTGITTEGTMILVLLLPPLLPLPVLACEDEVDEREEEVVDDVGG